MAVLAHSTQEELADALARLAAFAVGGGAIAFDRAAYEQAIADVDLARLFLQHYKAVLDRCPIPCTLTLDGQHMELIVKREGT